jgi:anti-sigma factor RsiW
MRDEERLIRSLDGELSESEAGALRERLLADRELAVRRDAWVAVREELGAGRPEFEPGFRDRVMARVGELAGEVRQPARGDQPGAESLYLHLQQAFPRLAAACLIGVVALGIYSLLADAGLANSAVEALLGIPGETLETAFALGGV